MPSTSSSSRPRPIRRNSVARSAAWSTCRSSPVPTVARQRLRVPPQRCVRREQLLQQPRGPRQARIQAESVRRHPRRPDLQGQDLLLRRLPGAPRDAGGDGPFHRADNRDAGRQLLGADRVIYDPTTGLPFPGNIIPERPIDSVARNILTQLYPEPNTAGTRQRQRTDDQQLSAQPDQEP